jgi:hypothetical protein
MHLKVSSECEQGLKISRAGNSAAQGMRLESALITHFSLSLSLFLSPSRLGQRIDIPLKY